jgi:hypothetical protein
MKSKRPEPRDSGLAHSNLNLPRQTTRYLAQPHQALPYPAKPDHALPNRAVNQEIFY